MLEGSGGEVGIGERDFFEIKIGELCAAPFFVAFGCEDIKGACAVSEAVASLAEDPKGVFGGSLALELESAEKEPDVHGEAGDGQGEEEAGKAEFGLPRVW